MNNTVESLNIGDAHHEIIANDLTMIGQLAPASA